MSEGADPESVQPTSSGGPPHGGGVGQVFERHLPGLMAYARLSAGVGIRGRESTWDLVQSACREVLQDLPSVEAPGEAGLRRWLYRALERKITDRARYWSRKRRRGNGLSGEQAEHVLASYATFCTPSQVAMAEEEIERIEGVFARLPDAFREVILLRRLVGLSHAEIGQRMERSEVAVRNLLHRALARLGVLLANGP